MWNQSRHDLENTARTDSVNQGTGKQLWRKTDIISSSYSAPVTDINENIYIYGIDPSGSYSTLYSLDSNGNLRWSFQSTDANNNPFYGYVNYEIVPTIGPDGTIYYTDSSGDSNSSFVFAVNPDGILKWRYVIPDTSIAGTIKLYGSSIYVIDYDFYVLDASTGNLIRVISNPSGFNDGFAIHNGYIYASLGSGQIVKIDPSNGNIIWNITPSDNLFSGISVNDSGLFIMGYNSDFSNYAFAKISLDGAQQWVKHIQKPDFGTGYYIYVGINSFPALDSTSVYFSVNSCYNCFGPGGPGYDFVDGRIFKYDFDGNPDTNWLDNSGNWITTGYSSISPVIDGDGFIYTGDAKKIVKVDPANANILWTYPINGQYIPSDLAIGNTGNIYYISNDSYFIDTIASEVPNLPVFGDGSDGDVVISVDSVLTKHTNYNNLTINDGIKLNTNGFRVRVKNTLTINGIIHNNGGGGGGGWGANYSDPGDCTNCNGSPGTGGLGYGGSGGYGNNDRLECGGDCVGCCASASAGGGGSGGIVTLLTAPVLSDLINFGFPYLAGGGGGGGSSNQYCNNVYPCSGPGFVFGGGGPGGNGGGVLILQAYEIIYGPNGSIETNGNDGTDGITRVGGCCRLDTQYGGGGGGGGGGAQFIVYNHGFDLSKHQVNAGKKGANPRPGQDGLPGNIYSYQVGPVPISTCIIERDEGIYTKPIYCYVGEGVFRKV